MGKIIIYRDYDVKESVILGVSKSFPNNYIVSYTDTNVIIKSLQRNKNDLNIRWQDITDQEGTVFSTFNELKSYLAIVFAPFKFRETEFQVEDNIPTNVAVINLPSTGFATTFSNILDGLNAINFSVESYHVPLFTYTDYRDNADGTGLDIYRTTRFFRGGSGDFGVDGEPVTIGHIGDIVETKKLTPDNVSTDLEALGEVVELGDIGSQDFVDFINTTNSPDYVLEENIIYFFTFTKDGVDYTYLFEGNQPVTLGAGNTQVVVEDFKLISKNGVEATELESNIPNVMLDFNLPNTGVPSTFADIVTALNSTTFSVLTKEVPMFTYTEYKYNADQTSLDLYRTTRFFKGGAGTFGIDNTLVTQDLIGNIVETEPLNPTTTDFNVIGQVIELGDTGGISLDTYLNTTNSPEYDLNGDDLYFFTFTKDLIDYTYLYEGQQPALLGQGNFQVAMSDFKLISKDSQNSVEVEQFELPVGRKDQVYFISEEGTNEIVPDWLMKKGIVVQTEREYDVASTQEVSLEDVFKTWQLFSHYNVDLGGGVSPPTFPALTPDDPQAGTRLTAEEFYAGGLWLYDSANDRIRLTKNVHPYTGFVSPREFGNFTFESTFSSPNGDDDFLALVIGFWTDPTTGYEHTLSVIRQLTESSGQGNFTYRVIKNFAQLTEEVIVDATDLAPYPSGTPGGWNVNSPTRVSVVRTGNTYSIKCSQFNSTVIDDTTEIVLDVEADPRLEVFKTATKVAFAARSQVDAYFSDIVFTGLIDYIFYKKGSTYETYEYDYNTENYILQDPQTILASNYFGANRFIDSYLFNKIYFITENNELININKDDVSWDANNALSRGSDLRPFLDSRLIGGTQNKKYSYVVQHLGGLDFKVTAAWSINGIDSGIPTPVVLNYTATPDATFSKYIMFVLNEDGTITVKEGEPSANPQEPTLDSPSSQLKGSFVQINSNGSVEGFSGTTIFDEDTGIVGGEFDRIFTPAGNTRFAVNANGAFSGSVGIDITNGVRFDAAEFIPENPVPFAPGDYIQYKLKNKAFFNKDETHAIMIQGLEADGATLASITLPVDLNYDANNYVDWQVLTAQIPAGLSFSKISYVRFLLTQKGNATYSGFLDGIDLISDTGVENPGSGVDATYVRNEDEKYLQLAKDFASSLPSGISLAPAYIDLGDIGSDLVEDAFNDDALALDIEVSSDQYTIIIATQEGVEREWLFVGQPNIYTGDTVLATATDFFLGGKGATAGTGGETIQPSKVDIIYDSGTMTTAFTVADSSKVTDVYWQGKKLKETDEWVKTDLTTITVNKPLSDGDWISIVSLMGNAIVTLGDIDQVVPITADTTLGIEHIGKILYVTASVTLTWPATGVLGFKANVECNSTGDATIVDENLGADIEAPNGDTLAADETAYLFIEPVASKLRISK